MYNNPVAMGAGATASGLALLPQTGMEAVWFLLGGFALAGAGSAILRLVPRREA